jgi:hypothetical protein
LSSFHKCIDNIVQNAATDDTNITPKDNDILKKWRSAKVTSNHAKEVFASDVRNPHFDSIWNLKEKDDRIKFTRYLFTGCIFVDESKITCGNPTMFTEVGGRVKKSQELFFETIGLNSESFNNEMVGSFKSLYDLIIEVTIKKTVCFRYLVQSAQIKCHFMTKYVNPLDLEFGLIPFKILIPFLLIGQTFLITWRKMNL